ncbi:MAG: hypothetical protein K2I03_10010, partial [Lachnospiraceae bacterium]|nr:hypothetical protein [Lachnospiraceae bacterium]
FILYPASYHINSNITTQNKPYYKTTKCEKKSKAASFTTLDFLFTLTNHTDAAISANNIGTTNT